MNFALHKPFGYLSQFVNNQSKRKNKRLLGELGAFPEGTMAIGRLDENSEGLLLLTTAGQVSEAVRGSKVEKEYFVEVEGIINEEALERMAAGVEIGIHGKRYTTKPCTTHMLAEDPKLPGGPTKVRHSGHGPTSWLSITITEGKFRQVRKMTAAVGFPTVRLIRMRIGDILLGNLAPGEYIEVEELAF